MNKIIAIEGLDASGKATHSKLLAERLRGTRFSFPNYESPTGKAILGHLKKEWTAVDYYGGQADCDALVFQSLQIANRLELVPQILEAATKGPVVFDRYWASGVVYGSLDGLESNWLEKVQALPMPPADVQILLDIDVEESFKRRPERRDRYELDREFLEKVRAAYLALFKERRTRAHKFKCERRPCTCDVRSWHVVKGTGTVEEVHARIMEVLNA